MPWRRGTGKMKPLCCASWVQASVRGNRPDMDVPSYVKAAPARRFGLRERIRLSTTVVGARWVEARPDPALSAAAKNVLGKIATASPEDLRDRISNTGLWPVPKWWDVEAQPLLGVLREDDLPGSEAPGAWLAYLRGGGAGKLRRVGLHNAQDVRSLCGLLEAMQDVAEGDSTIGPLPAIA